MSNSSRKPWRPFRSLADALWRRWLLPTPRMVGLTAAGAGAIVLGSLAGYGWVSFGTVNGLLVFGSLLDISLLPRRHQLAIRRLLPEQADLGADFEVGILLESRTPVSLGYQLADDLPQSFTVEKGALSGTMEGTQAASTYSVKTTERGRYTFRRLHVRIWGSLGLWSKLITVRSEQEIHIYPDLSAVRGILASVQSSLILDGRRIFKKERSGSEFHMIREYVPDDDPRFINWRASARTGTMMTNVHRPERGKQVTLMLDCGRMMGIELDGRTKLDVTLEAALTLAAVALRQGDQVSVVAFSNRILAYVPPGKGMQHMHVILQSVFDLQSEFVESDYSTAMQYLMRVQKKRSLVVLFSDMENYLFEDQLLPYLLRMKRTHYMLLLAIQDEVLAGLAHEPAPTKRAAYIRSVAQKWLLERKRHSATMTAQNIDVLDVPVGQLAVSAVNRYLEIKSRDIL